MSKALYIFPSGQNELGFPSFVTSPAEGYSAEDEALGISLINYNRLLWDLLVPGDTPQASTSVEELLKPVDTGNIRTRLEFRIAGSFLSGKPVPVLLWRETPVNREFDPICGAIFLSAKTLAALSVPEAPPLARAIGVAMGLPEEDFPLTVDPFRVPADAPYAAALDQVIQIIGSGVSDEGMMSVKLDDLMLVPSTTIVRTVPEPVVVAGVGIGQGQASADMETAGEFSPAIIEENNIVIVHRTFITVGGWLRLCAFAQGLAETAYYILGLGDEEGDNA